MIRTLLAGCAGAFAVAGAALGEGHGYARTDAYAPAGYDRHGRPIDYAGAAHRVHIHHGRRYRAHCYEVTNSNYLYN
ncbi:MAG: hypothetical protein MI723_10285, partial [Caulobacterales bacterium]|nr:hypothetical protein [Caulobacterales bacterium]